MQRTLLPQNYILDEGTLIEGFGCAAEWEILSAQNGSTWVDDPDVFRTGSQSLRCTAINGYLSIQKEISIKLNPRMIGLWVYLHSEVNTISEIDLRLSSSPYVTKFYRVKTSASLGGIMPPSHIVEGWNFLTFHRDEFENYNGESWENTMIKLKLVIYAVAQKTGIISLDSLYYDFECQPARLLLTFDDGRNSVITDGCFKYMNDRGIKGTEYVISSTIGTSGAMTKGNLDTLYAAGWAIGNHTLAHSHLTQLTQAQMEAALKGCTDWLIANGYIRAAYHHAYPFGEYNNAVQAACANAGILTARTTFYSLQSTPPGNLYTLQIWDAGTPTHTLAQAKALIDAAIRYQKTLIFMFHHFVVSNPGNEEWTYTDFHALIDYITARKIPCLTIDEWYKGLTNPRYRSLPLDMEEV